jgi:ribosomal protein S18 acetylase RimI-like enzyme
MHAKIIINKIRNKLYARKTYFLFEAGFLRDVPEPKFDIREVTQENLDDAAIFQSAEYLATFKKFLSQGDCGFYAYIDDQCIHRSWLVNSGIIKPHWSLEYSLKPKQSYIHYCETSEAARGMGVYPEVLKYIRMNYKLADSFLINVESNNIPSIKGIEKAGFEKVREVKVRIFAGIKFNRTIYYS